MAYEITNSQLIIDDCFDGKEEWAYDIACCYRAVVTGLLDHPTETDRLIATVEWTEAYPFNEVAETSGVWVSSSCFNCLLPPGVDELKYWICINDNVLILDSGDTSANDRFLIVGLDAKYHTGDTFSDFIGYVRTDDTVAACGFFKAGFAIDTSVYIDPYFIEQVIENGTYCNPVNPNSYGLPKGTDSEYIPSARVGEFITVIGENGVVYPVRPYQIPNFDLWFEYHTQYEVNTSIYYFTEVTVVNGQLVSGRNGAEHIESGSFGSYADTYNFYYTPFTMCPRNGAIERFTPASNSDSITETRNFGLTFTWSSGLDPELAHQTVPIGVDWQDSDLNIYKADAQDWNFIASPIYDSDGFMIGVDATVVSNAGTSMSVTTYREKTVDYYNVIVNPATVKYVDGTLHMDMQKDESEEFNTSTEIVNISGLVVTKSLSYLGTLTETHTTADTRVVYNPGNYPAEYFVITEYIEVNTADQIREAMQSYTLNGDVIGNQLSKLTFNLDKYGKFSTSEGYRIRTWTDTASGFGVLVASKNAKAIVILEWDIPEGTVIDDDITVTNAYAVINYKMYLIFPGISKIELESWTVIDTSAWYMEIEREDIMNFGGALDYDFTGQDTNTTTQQYVAWNAWTAYDNPEGTIVFDKIEGVVPTIGSRAVQENNGNVGTAMVLGVADKLHPQGNLYQWQCHDSIPTILGLPGGKFYPYPTGPAEGDPIYLAVASDNKQVKLKYWYETGWKTRYFSETEEYTIAEVEER